MTLKSRNYANGQNQDVLNGIAILPSSNIFVITGKYWPLYYLSHLDL